MTFCRLSLIIQIGYREELIMMSSPTAPTYGAHNIWDLYDLEFAGEIPCPNAAAFFHMLYSSSTHAARVAGGHTGQGWADFVLYGPVTDDANGEINYDEKNDVVVEKAKSSATSRTLTHEEVTGSRKYEGFEAEACLTTKFRLYKADVEQRFASEESRDGLVARMMELGIAGNMLDRTCSTYGLRRVEK